MTLAQTIFTDFAEIGFGISMALCLVMNIFWLFVFFCTDVNTLIDFAWGSSQFLIAALCFALRYSGGTFGYGYLHNHAANTTTSDHIAISNRPDVATDVPVRNIITLIIVFIWSARLAGFILYHRVCAGEKDIRYEMLAARNGGGGDAVETEGAKMAAPNTSGPESPFHTGPVDSRGGIATTSSSSSSSESNAAAIILVADEEQRRKSAAAAAATAAASSQSSSGRRTFFIFQFIFQALMLPFCAAPQYWIFAHAQQDGTTGVAKDPAFWIGLALVIAGLAITTVADNQLEAFKHEQAAKRLTAVAMGGHVKKTLMRVGLWNKSRHPNLFGELVVQTGFAFLGLDWYEPASLVSLFGFSGPLLLYLVMKYLTIPATETSMRRSRDPAVWQQFLDETNEFWIF